MAKLLKGEDRNRTLPLIRLPVEVAKEKLMRFDWDNFIIISGDVGTGKSNLALSFLEAWNREINGKAEHSDLDYMCMDIKQFVARLNGIERYKMIILDESGELSNLRQMDLFNFQLTKTYQVIRGLNLFTILIIPSVFRLNQYFVWDRARALIHVYKRDDKKGHSIAGYYTKRQLRLLMSLNEKKAYKKISMTPLFYNYFFKYEGVYKDAYLNKKEARISTITQELQREIERGGAKVTQYEKLIYKLVDSKTATPEQIATLLKTKVATVEQNIRKFKRNYIEELEIKQSEV